MFNDNLTIFFYTSKKYVHMALRSPTIIYIWSVALAPRLTNCCVFVFFSNCSLTLLHINKLMTKSHRELPWITGKSRGKETSFFLNSSKQGLLTATDETGLLFSFTSAIHPPHWASFWSVSFPPSLFFSPRRKWPWRVGRLWAEASQSRFEKRGRRSETSRWIFRPHVGAARARTRTRVCMRVRSSGGLSAQVGLTQESVSEVASEMRQKRSR